MERINYLDYAKGLTMVLLMMIHVGFYQVETIILFAMPLYFMCTGYSFTPNKRSFKEIVLLRFKTIMLPFYFYMLLYAVIEIFRAYLLGYGTYEVVFASITKAVYGSGIMPFNGRLTEYLREVVSYKGQPAIGVDIILPTNCNLWFLPATFIACILFTAVLESTRKNHFLKAVFIAIFLAVASLEVVFPTLTQLPFGIGRGAIGACFMLVGFYLKEYKFFEKKSNVFHIVVCLCLIAVYVATLLLGSNGSALVRSYYGPYGAASVVLTFVGGSCGAVVALELCRLIEKVPFERLKNLLSFAGKNVMTTYVTHMAIKFVLDVFYIVVLHDGNSALLDKYKMGLLPDVSPIYMAIEVVILTVACLLIAKLKNHLKNRKKLAKEKQV